jgi:hypothetical protein
MDRPTLSIKGESGCSHAAQHVEALEARRLVLSGGRVHAGMIGPIG